ncbi:MAG: NAD(P)-dependent oxidoreductase, partial [Planctomycetales bacterium]|nr:NAD(P)-dependent oxidoreductase [Planctomycetales bacterium]
MSNDRTILVTGGGGFVGGRVAESIHLSGFGRARAGVRRWSSAARLCRFPIDVVMCDIMKREDAVQAVEGAQAVVHCAYTDDKTSIVEGTRNMLEAALNCGVERFVFLSTAEVYGSDVQGDVLEAHETPYTGRPYADGKIDAERLCLEYQAKGLPVTILRPSLIYGPMGQSWTVRVAARLQSGNWGTFDEYGSGYCNLIYVDDLVRAIFAAIENPHAVGETFNVNGPDVVTWNEYFQRFNERLGMSPLESISPRQSRLKSMLRDRAQVVASAAVNRFQGLVTRINQREGLGSAVIK